MLNQTISNSKYIFVGLMMVILCTFVMVILIYYLQNQVTLTKEYKADTCKLSSIQQTTVSVDCWIDDTVTIVDMPCLIVRVNTSTHSNVLFFRSIGEKITNVQNKLEVETQFSFHILQKIQNLFKICLFFFLPQCSYIPTTCNNDPVYLANLIKKSYTELFPPLDYVFDCYVLASKSTGKVIDSLLYIPIKSSYYSSLLILVVGFLLGISTIIYGWSNMQINNPKSKYFGKSNVFVALVGEK